MIKASALLALAFCVVRALRRRSASERHLVWVGVLAVAAVLPLASGFVPRWQPEIARRAIAILPALTPAGAVDDAVDGDVVVRADSVEPAGEATQVFLTIWLCGATVMVSATCRARRRLVQYGQGATSIDDPIWRELVSRISLPFGISRPVTLRRSAYASVPVTWGVLAPCVLLPCGADSWPNERKRVVLAHELAHVARRDWAVQFAARLVCSIYWFNPLFWFAYRALRLESERACDDAVLALAVRG